MNTLPIVGLVLAIASIFIFLKRKRRNPNLTDSLPKVVTFSSESDALGCTVTVRCGGQTYQLCFKVAPGWIPKSGQSLRAAIDGKAEEEPVLLPKELRLYQVEEGGRSLRFQYLYKEGEEEEEITYDVNLSLERVAECLQAVAKYRKKPLEEKICSESTDAVLYYLEGGQGFSTTMVEGPVPEE